VAIDVAPTNRELDPAVQFTHVSTVAAPVFSEYVPAAQSEHVDIVRAPTVLEYVPGAHESHVLTLVPGYLPAAQKHLSTEVAPTLSAYVPGTHGVHTSELRTSGHAEHAPDPLTVLYVPTTHALHATPSDSAVNPTLHVQSVSKEDCTGELVPTGQAKQLIKWFALGYD
jgi:hypothetical protein